MIKHLLLCKRLFGEGKIYAERSDSVSSGLAISLFQDAVESNIWALIKEKNLSVKDSDSFTKNIATIQNAGIALSNIAKIHELNKARVGFKHYGNLPDPGEAKKFETYVEDFLRTSYRDNFCQNFDEISLVDLISDLKVRSRLKSAESFVKSGEFIKAINECAIAKVVLFTMLDRFVPKVNTGLRNIDSAFGHVPELRGLRIQPFQYLTEYLGSLRETIFAALLKLQLSEYAFLHRILPSAYQTANGKWHINQHPNFNQINESTCNRVIESIINISINIERLL